MTTIGEDDLIIFKEIFEEEKETPNLTPTQETRKESTLHINTKDENTESTIGYCLNDYKLNVEKDYKETKHELDEKKIMEIWILKNKLFKEIKEKRIERNKQLKANLIKLKLEREKKYLTQNYSKDEFYNNKLTIFRQTNKILVKQIIRNKKKKKRLLKFKKYMKQLKKKNKLKKNFLRHTSINIISSQKKNKLYENCEQYLQTNIKDFLKRKNLGNRLDDLGNNIITEFNKRKVKMEEELIREDEYSFSEKLKLRVFDNTNLKSNMSVSRRTDVGKNTKYEKKNENQTNDKQDISGKIKSEKKEKIHEKIEELRKKENDFLKSKINFQSLIENIKKDVIVKTIEESDESTKEHFDKIKEIEVKQRVIGFQIKAFDTINLKNILTFWKGNFKSFNDLTKTDEMDKRINEKDITKSKVANVIKEETKKKNEINVKYEYQEPSTELKDIIPFCNNFFMIQDND